MNAVAGDAGGQLRDRQIGDFDEMFAFRRNALAVNAVVRRPERVGENLEAGPVVVAKHAVEQMANRMVVEVAGKIADAQALGASRGLTDVRRAIMPLAM